MHILKFAAQEVITIETYNVTNSSIKKYNITSTSEASHCDPYPILFKNLTTLLRYNSHFIQFIRIKCAVQ